MKSLCAKHILVLAGIVFFVFGLHVQNTYAENLLEAHWTFNDESGNPTDFSGNNVTLNNVGTPQYLPNEGLHGAVSFDGTNYFSNSGDIDLANSAFTISAWINADSLDRDYFGLGSNAAANEALHLRVHNDGVIRFGFYDNDLDVPSSITVGNWYHIVAMYNLDSGERVVYLDGEEIGSDISVSPYIGDTTLTVGTSIFHNWDGMVDDMRIYKRELNPEEVVEIYNDYLESPTVLGVTPLDTSIDVPVDTHLVLDFSESMDSSSFVISTDPCQGECMTYDIFWAEGEYQVTFSPTGNFEPGTTYTISISIDDAQGTPMENGYEWSFTTAGQRRNSSTQGFLYGCRDQKALNYQRFSSHKDSLCKYAALANTVPVQQANQDPLASFNRNLSFGVTGEDVNRLQNILVCLNTGPAAVALKNNGTTNYFGPLTKTALVEYQKSKNITPAVGFFGPITRGLINKSCGAAGLQKIN